MASSCEVLLDTDDARLAGRVIDAVAIGARRVEAKYSRHRDGDIVAAPNAATGRPVALDSETARLVDFAARVHALSNGLFDLTQGALTVPPGMRVDFGGIAKEHAVDRRGGGELDNSPRIDGRDRMPFSFPRS